MNLETAYAIKNVAQQSIVDNNVLESARKIIAGLHNGVDIDELGDLLFNYSATLTSTVATGVAVACLGVEGFDKMADALMENEVENFVKDIEKWTN